MLNVIWVLAASLLATHALGLSTQLAARSNVYAGHGRLAGRSPPAPPGMGITPEIDAYAQALLAQNGVPGLSVGVVRLNATEHHAEARTWGNMTEDGEPVSPETLFSIGSCSKAFLSVAMGILMDDFAHGRNATALPGDVRVFDWHTKIQALLPGWKLEDEWATAKASVRDILSHVTGLTRHDFSYSVEETPQSMLSKLPYLKPGYELREHWSYNNIMYVMGAHIISTYSGVAYRDFVKKRIFEPLGMASSTFSGSEAAASGLLSQSFAQGRRIPYWFADSNGFIDGPGGIISSTGDMLRWVGMLLNSGVDPRTNTTIVPLDVYTVVMTAAAIIPPSISGEPLVGYALGWLRHEYKGHQMVEHNGGLPGFLSQIYLLPDDGIGIVAFVNSDDPAQTPALVPLAIIDNLLGLDSTPLQTAADSSAAATPSPDTPDPAAPSCKNSTALEKYEGTYANAGYGNFTLCAPTSASDYCAGVLAALAPTPPGVDALYAAWPRVWASHLRLLRLCDDRFRLTAGTPFPHGYGADETPFVYVALGPEAGVDVECVERDGAVVGCGIMNIEEHDGPRSTEGSVEERADVWFVKV